MIDHVVTQEDVDNNPGEDLKVGEEIQIPVPAEEEIAETVTEATTEESPAETSTEVPA